MSDTPHAGGDGSRLPGSRVEPRLDWAGEAAAFYRGRAQDSEAALGAAMRRGRTPSAGWPKPSGPAANG